VLNAEWGVGANVEFDCAALSAGKKSFDFVGGGLEDLTKNDAANHGEVSSASPLPRSTTNPARPPAVQDDSPDALINAAAEPGEEARAERVDRGHHLDAAPAKLLRHLLSDYVRGAEFVFNVFIYDCECWESPDTIDLERGPDVTVPFCERVELGLGAALVDHSSTEDFQSGFIGEATSEGLGPDFSLDEMLQDKGFVKAVSGSAPDVKICTPDLTVTMYPMDVDGVMRDTARDALELADSAYLHLVVSSIPHFTLPLSSAKNAVTVESFEPLTTSANPGFPWLEVQTVAPKAGLLDLIKKKDKKQKDVETIREALKTDARTHNVGLLDIRTSVSSRLPFLIAVDGQVFGPFYRVRIRPSTALSTSGGQALQSRAPIIHFPVSTFSPVWMGV
jgi:hypothetical protein